MPRLAATEVLPLRNTLGHTLASDVISGINVPAHDSSAMYSYALRGTEARGDGDTVLQVAGSGLAGEILQGSAGPGQCVRIMTGAVMPAGLNTVVPQEFVREADGAIAIPAGILRPGDNRRLAGEDLDQG